MATPTTHLALVKATTADPFSTADLAANWQKVDDSPGCGICTSTTRPSTWGGAQQGMEINETDTGLKWKWNGSEFVRSAPTGMLKTTSGAWARGQRFSPVSTTVNTYVVALAVNNVVVPAGLRPLMIIATWPRVFSTSGMAALGIWRSNVNSQAPRLGSWWVSGDYSSPAQGAAGGGASYVTYEQDGLAAGTYNYSLQFCSEIAGQTSTIMADGTTPMELKIIEM